MYNITLFLAIFILTHTITAQCPIKEEAQQDIFVRTGFTIVPDQVHYFEPFQGEITAHDKDGDVLVFHFDVERQQVHPTPLMPQYSYLYYNFEQSKEGLRYLQEMRFINALGNDENVPAWYAQGEMVARLTFEIKSKKSFLKNWTKLENSDGNDIIQDSKEKYILQRSYDKDGNFIAKRHISINDYWDYSMLLFRF